MNQWIECRQQLMLVRVHHVKGTSSVTFVYEGDLSATTATAIAKFNSRSSGKQPVLRLNLARGFFWARVCRCRIDRGRSKRLIQPLEQSRDEYF